MDTTGGHHVEWNKPGPERQIPHGLPYMWELKFKKQTKEKEKRNVCISIAANTVL